MTTINSALSSYYQLSGSSSQTSSNSSGSQSSTNALGSLLAALGNGTSSNSSNSATTANAYSLDLSDSAKAYLAGLSTSPSSASSTNTFLLSPKQRDALDAILAKYKDTPVTQENYDALQDDLDAAGLAPKQLAIRDQLRELNPTRIFLDALNGQDDGQQPQFGEMTDAQKTQGNNYMQAILSQWQSTAPEAPSDDSTTVA